MRDGVLVSYRDEKGTLKKARLRVFNFEEPTKNHFLCVRELWIKGDLYRKRPDIVGFVNGLPLLFMELKNIHRDLRRAYEENLVRLQGHDPASLRAQCGYCSGQRNDGEDRIAVQPL